VSWFDDARLGLFFHWGISSVSGRELSWPLVGGVRILPRAGDATIADYYADAAAFDAAGFDATEWARIAVDVGARYGVLTARHHDGFSMFASEHSEFSVAARHGRDLVREFVDAFRAAGLNVGLYYSLSDWHHPDYPAFTEADKPYRFEALPQPTDEQWARYLDYLFGQLRELCTNYGTIDEFWFDGQWERTPDAWKPVELRALIREWQPDAIVNDRLPGQGDFDTPEQFVPPEPPPRPWEVCLTMNESWGYNPADTDYKSSRSIVHTLTETAGRGGNLLLNVGPQADGSIPLDQLVRLDALATWMSAHREAITGTESGLEPWQFYGPSTRRGDTVYLHLLSRPYEEVVVRGVRTKRVTGVRMLGVDRPLEYSTRTSILDQMFNSDPFGELRIAVPEEAIDPIASVIAVEFANPPST
jgi:alpha-L-fucosidase